MALAVRPRGFSLDPPIESGVLVQTRQPGQTRLEGRYTPVPSRPIGPATAKEETVREDDEVLNQLQSTHARISIWSLLASSTTHRETLIRALSRIRVDTTTSPEGLIHMLTVGRASCICFL